MKRKRGNIVKSPPAAANPLLAAAERDRRLYEAVVAYRAGRYAEADAQARSLLTEAPEFFPAVLLLGMVAGAGRRTAEGIELLRRAVALDPHSLEARSELAALLRTEGRHEEAVAAARHAVRLRPDDPGGRNNLGLCYLAAGRVPAAIEEFQHAIALKPEAPVFHHNLGLALQQQSRDFEAIAAFRRALELGADSAEAHAHLGQLLYQHGEPEEATRHYERASTLQSDGTLAATHRAEALVQQGEVAEAESCLRAALAAEPDSDLLHQVLGVLLQRLGRFEEAATLLARAVALQPRRISAYVSLVRGKRIGDEDSHLLEAMEGLARDRDLAPRDRSSLHFALGKAYDDLGDCKRAIGHFDQANELEADAMRRAGRWFDRRAHAAFIERVIAAFPATRFAGHPDGGPDSELPIVIVGMPRSGTTLVEQILSSHREVAAAAELSYWTDRATLAATPEAVPADGARLRELAQGYLELLATAGTTARRVTDKMPANFLVLGLIHLALPRARIIHCRRNPLDTCLSIYSTPVGNVLDFAHERGNLVFYYQQYLRLMEHWRRVIPADRLFEIDYEELVAEPERLTRALVAFCGVGWDEACLSHERNPHVIMTPSLWQARQPVYRDAAGRWRRYEPWLGAFAQLAQRH